MSRITTATVLISALCALAASVHAEGILYYDPPTGEVFFDVDTNGQGFVGLAIRSPSSEIMPSEYQRLGGETILFLQTESHIADLAGFGISKPDGLFSLGAIFPANRSIEAVEASIAGGWGITGSIVGHPFVLREGRPEGTPINDPTLSRLDDDAWATDATLEYNAGSGELMLVTDGFLTGFGLQPSESATWYDDAFFAAVAGARFDGSFYHSIGLLEPGEYPLGAVLDPGLTPTELGDAFDKAVYLGQAGVGVSTLNLASTGQSLDLVHVPEPAFGHLPLLWIAVVLLRYLAGVSQS